MEADMANLTVDPLAIVAVIGFGLLMVVSFGVTFVFWRLSRQK